MLPVAGSVLEAESVIGMIIDDFASSFALIRQPAGGICAGQSFGD